jgi:hypothetical protein
VQHPKRVFLSFYGSSIAAVFAAAVVAVVVVQQLFLFIWAGSFIQKTYHS